MRRCRKLCLPLLALAGLAALAVPALAKVKLATLEGTRFAIHVETGEKTDARGEQSFEEVVSFADGKVSLETCAGRGYATSAYTARKDGDKWLVRFAQASPTDGTMTWDGDVREEWFKGVMLWKRKDGKERNFWFKGKLVKEGKKK